VRPGLALPPSCRSQRSTHRSVSTSDEITHLSPAMYAHVNKHGKYRFNVDRLQAGQLRPLRQPTVGTP
jgi:hypothetical protein